jgi:hypothetical protein
VFDELIKYLYVIEYRKFYNIGAWSSLGASKTNSLSRAAEEILKKLFHCTDKNPGVDFWGCNSLQFNSMQF